MTTSPLATEPRLRPAAETAVELMMRALQFTLPVALLDLLLDRIEAAG
jgi:hypothetical protein